MLSVVDKPFMLSVIMLSDVMLIVNFCHLCCLSFMLSVVDKLFMLSATILNVIILNVFMLSVFMLSAVKKPFIMSIIYAECCKLALYTECH